jgi:hypothetical protein
MNVLHYHGYKRTLGHRHRNRGVGIAFPAPIFLLKSMMRKNLPSRFYAKNSRAHLQQNFFSLISSDDTRSLVSDGWSPPPSKIVSYANLDKLYIFYRLKCSDDDHLWSKPVNHDIFKVHFHKVLVICFIIHIIFKIFYRRKIKCLKT